MSDCITRTSQSERTAAAAGHRDTMTGDEKSMMYGGRLILVDVQLVMIIKWKFDAARTVRATPSRGSRAFMIRGFGFSIWRTLCAGEIATRRRRDVVITAVGITTLSSIIRSSRCGAVRWSSAKLLRSRQTRFRPDLISGLGHHRWRDRHGDVNLHIN